MKINSISNQNQYKPLKSVEKQNSSNNSTSFKGITDFAIKPLTKFYGEVAKSGVFQKGVEKISSSNRTFTHLMVLDSVILSSFYTINSLRNKKIEKEQKPQMVINDALTLAVSASGSYLLDDKVSKAVNKFGNSYISKHEDFYKNLAKSAQEKLGAEAPIEKLKAQVEEVIKLPKDKVEEGVANIGKTLQKHFSPIVSKEAGKKALMTTQEEVGNLVEGVTSFISESVKSGKTEKLAEQVTKQVGDTYNTVAAKAQADKFMTGLNKLKVLVVFGLIYRYIGPVLVTPLANKLSDKFFDKKKGDKAGKTAAKAPEKSADTKQNTQVSKDESKK